MNVSLTKQQRAYVQDKVKSGRYSSASEVVREALRITETLELDRESIEQALDEADESGYVEVKDHKKFWKEFWAEGKSQPAKKSAA